MHKETMQAEMSLNKKNDLQLTGWSEELLKGLSLIKKSLLPAAMTTSQ